MESSRREYYESYGKRNIIRELPPDSPLLFHEKLRLHRMVPWLPPHSQRVLDCGCGRGDLARLIESHKKEVVALDLSWQRLKKNQQEFPQSLVKNITADSCQIPFQSQSFDVVVVSELLEHVPEDKAMLTEIWRVLKKQGRFILSVPYKEMVNTVICPNCQFEFYRHGHLRSYDKPFLKNQLQAVGFHVRHLCLSNNLKTRFLRARRFLPFSWIVRLDSWYSLLFPEQSRFLIAVGEKP